MVGTAKVDGALDDFLHLQDKVTAELLRSAGMAAEGQAHRRARARAAEVDAHPRAVRRRRRRRERREEGRAAQARRRRGRVVHLRRHRSGRAREAHEAVRGGVARQAGREDARAPRRVRQGEGSAEAGDDGGPGVGHAAAGAALSHHGRRSARSLAAGPAAAATMPGAPPRRRDGAATTSSSPRTCSRSATRSCTTARSSCAAFPRRVFRAAPSRPWTSSSARSTRSRRARRRSRTRWRACRPSSAGTCAASRTEYAFAHQYREAQRLFHACFAVGGVDKHALPQLIQADVALGDWAAARKDLGELEKADPEMYRTMKVGYEMAIPSDV